MTIQDDLLSDIESFLKATGQSGTAFGISAVNDGKLVPRLRAGANMTLGTLEKIRKYLDDHPVPTKAPQAAE